MLITSLTRSAALFCALTLITSAIAPSLRAQTAWTNTGSDDWTVGSNWSNGVPDSSTNTSINNGGTATLSGIGAASLLNVGTGSGNSGAFIQSSGALTVGGAIHIGNAGTGSITVNGGTVSGGSQAYIGEGGAGTLTVTDGTFAANELYVGAFDGATGNVTVSGGILSISSSLYLGYGNGAATLTISGGTVSSGNNMLSIAPTGTGTGAINLNGGTLLTSGIDGGGVTGNGSLTFNGGTLRATSNNSGLIRNFNTGTVQIASGGVVIDTQSFSVNPSIVLQGAGSLVKTGAGILTLTDANTYGGTTTVNGGELRVNTFTNGGAASSIGTSSSDASSLVLNGGTLLYIGGGTTSDRLFSVGTGGGTIGGSEDGATLTLTNTGTIGFNDQTGARTLNLIGNGPASLAAVIADNSGATSLAKLGGGTWTLTGTNTNTGTSTIYAGAIEVGTLANGGTASNLGASSSSADSLVLDGGTLRYTGSSATIDRLFSVGASGGSGRGTLDVTTPGQTLTLANTGNMGFNGQTGDRTLTLTGAGNGVLGADIGDNGGATSLTKTGAGTWSLSATNTYTGGTNVQEGTLRVNGSIATSSLTDVNSSGTLTGTGIVGALRISGGGTLSPGNSPGTMHADATTFGSNGIFLLELNSVNGTAGANPGWDLLSISGGLTLRSLPASPFIIKLTSLNLLDAADNVPDFDASASYSFVFASTTGGITSYDDDGNLVSFDPATFTVDTSAFSNAFTGTWSVAQSGNDLSLLYSAVPEPSTYALIYGTAVLGVAVWRRRRAA